MAQQKNPVSVQDFLKNKLNVGKTAIVNGLSKNRFTKHFVDVLGYIPDDDIDDPVNGMQSDFDPAQSWATLGNAGVQSYADNEKPLSEKEELKLKERLQRFADEYGLKLQYNVLYNDYTLKDSSGADRFNVKKTGNFKYTGYDLVGEQYKEMIKISAGQFKNNKKLVYPYVAENNPKIPDAMQAATLRLMISTMLEEGISIERIRIKSKKWKHLIDEYKTAEELKNEEILQGNSGINQKANPSQGPPSVDGSSEIPAEEASDKNEVSSKSPEATDKKDEQKSETVVSEAGDAGNATDEKNVEAVVEKPAYDVEKEQKRLMENLVWALGEADGNIALLASANQKFHKENFEISFTKNAEMVHISNVRPNEDGNIVNINISTSKITNGNVYIGQMDEYTKVIDSQKANGFLKHKLNEAVNFTKGDYEAFREKMQEDKRMSWGFTKDERHLYASLEKENGEIEFGKVSLAKGYGEKLVASKKGLLSNADLQEDKANTYTDNYDDVFFGADFHKIEGAGKPDEKPAAVKSSTRLTI
ncbi:hypothetical protein ALP72_02274 [Pseudomonas coronafaciens pv. coronafaciens]|uniref:hypothetical protein n=1 Tax=Pseudomonas coronafaciens TaxID=53409 RepID=UPI000EFFAE85|nr:hypothetical protein [Pseudomonas coronafaciens]RMS11864.1 hypothetical protein ALP72_02274 [Pseudomonas coronafaciens pv. coronafaciens]